MTTIRQAIIDAAENLAGHTVTAGPTISDALDALTDVLAGEDVQGAQTIADAFAILGQHLSGGGGELGPQVSFFIQPEGGDKLYISGVASDKESDLGQVDDTRIPIHWAEAESIALPEGIWVGVAISGQVTFSSVQTVDIDPSTGAPSFEDFTDYTVSDSMLKFQLPHFENDHTHLLWFAPSDSPTPPTPGIS